MAQQLVTQVDEDARGGHTIIPVERLTPIRRSTRGGAVDGESASTALGSAHTSGGGHVPVSCWRVFMSYLFGSSSLAAPGVGVDVAPDSFPLDSPPAAIPRPLHSTPTQRWLLPATRRDHCTRTKKCMVLDLDETLVHSSFKPIPNPDFVLSIELDGVTHKVSGNRQ